MSLGRLIIELILIILISDQVQSTSICTRRITNVITYVSVRSFSSKKTYNIPNCRMRYEVCLKTRVKKNYYTVTLSKTQSQVEKVCCKGYVKSKLSTAAQLRCEPVCSNTCINGRCVAPNKCECNSGYENSQNEYICEAYCKSGCPNGICTAPNTCSKCNKGYKLSNKKKICEPFCPSGCSNGVCARPNVCKCNSGYEMSNNKTCDPYCRSRCPHGTCISPNVCKCNNGYIMSRKGTCDPSCSSGCPNGTCIGPNECKCDSGYEMSRNKSCKPYCSSGCLNGICVGPNVCKCNSGYKMSDKKICNILTEKRNPTITTNIIIAAERKSDGAVGSDSKKNKENENATKDFRSNSTAAQGTTLIQVFTSTAETREDSKMLVMLLGILYCIL